MLWLSRARRFTIPRRDGGLSWARWMCYRCSVGLVDPSMTLRERVSSWRHILSCSITLASLTSNCRSRVNWSRHYLIIWMRRSCSVLSKLLPKLLTGWATHFFTCECSRIQIYTESPTRLQKTILCWSFVVWTLRTQLLACLNVVIWSDTTGGRVRSKRPHWGELQASTIFRIRPWHSTAATSVRTWPTLICFVCSPWAESLLIWLSGRRRSSSWRNLPCVFPSLWRRAPTNHLQR